MLDGLVMLLMLSTLMAIASFLAGSLPLFFSLSQSQLRLISTIGMGVLVGTALIVIIPEGVETLYNANNVEHAHMQRSIQSVSFEMDWQRRALPDSTITNFLVRREGGIGDSSSGLTHPVIRQSDLDATSTSTSIALPSSTPNEPTRSDESTSRGQQARHEDENQTPHAWVGVSLILGFILMYLIDTIPSMESSAPPQRSNIYSLSDLSSALPSSPSPKRSFSTTLGLVIHSAADGIALGASSTQPSLSFIIFFAILVHKAPAAFGLTSVLLKQGLSKRQARVHLAAFSLAAPTGAIFTWFVSRILGGSGGTVSEIQSTKWWTGVILLFSAGTFLYVAMHTMQENENGLEESHGHGNGYVEVHQGRDPDRQKPKKDVKHVMAALFGFLLPLVTQAWHAH